MAEQPYEGPERPLRPTGTEQPQEGRCGAKLRRSEQKWGHVRYCAAMPIGRSRRCYIHGGRTPTGVASPHFRTGAHSRALPQRMRTAYESALIDPELLSLRREVATHRAIAEDLKTRMAVGEANSPVTRSRWREFEKALASGNKERIRKALGPLKSAIEGPDAEWYLRSELRKEDELVEKCLRAENLRMEQLHQMLTREQVLAFMRGLAQSVKDSVEQHVVDAHTRALLLRAIGSRFELLADRRGPADLDAGGALIDAGDAGDPSPAHG